MIERIRRHKVKTPSSLYFGLIKNILIGVFVAFFMFFVIRIAADFYITSVFLSEEKKEARREEHIEELLDFIVNEDLAENELDELSRFVKNRRYLFLLVYNEDGELAFSSGEGMSGQTIVASGATVVYPTVDELYASALAGERYELALADGVAYAYAVEYSEHLRYDIANVLSFIAGVIALGVVLVIYLGKVISRIKKLGRDVSIVSSGNTDYMIFTEGGDEISALSEDVERMRKAMLLNIEREREVRDANKELVTSMSHDIRTPLTVLLGYLDMMKTQTEHDETLHGYVLSSEKTALRLKQLSDDMFNYSLAFGDVGSKIALEEYDAKTLIEQMLSEHVLLLMEQGYKVELSGVETQIEEGSVILTDAPNLMRIIDNIFSNMYKYADPTLPIRISSRRISGNIIMLEFRNGILKNNRAQSNRIGLKTCAKLARFIAEGFSYESAGEEFAARLSLKITMHKRIG